MGAGQRTGVCHGKDGIVIGVTVIGQHVAGRGDLTIGVDSAVFDNGSGISNRYRSIILTAYRDRQISRSSGQAIGSAIGEDVSDGLAATQLLHRACGIIERVGISATRRKIEGAIGALPHARGRLRKREHRAGIYIAIVNQHIAGGRKYTILCNRASIGSCNRAVVLAGHGNHDVTGCRDQSIAGRVAEGIRHLLPFAQGLYASLGIVQGVGIGAIGGKTQRPIRALHRAGRRNRKHGSRVNIAVISQYIAACSKRTIFADRAGVQRCDRCIIGPGNRNRQRRRRAQRCKGIVIADRNGKVFGAGFSSPQRLHKRIVQRVRILTIALQRQRTVLTVVGACVGNTE